MKKILLVSLGFCLFIFSNIIAQQKISKNHKYENIDCSICHSCKFPTAQKPCLNPCPRFEIMNTYTFNKEGPENIIIDTLQNIYGPVNFPHKLHAEMSKISGGCIQCHHYNTTDNIEPCSDCHNKDREKAVITRPDLRGAYHQQCMNCHRKWSHQTECNSCHTPNDKLLANISSKPKVKTKIKHPQLKTPDKIVFKTFTNKGKMVTFYHDEHINKFGIKCASCHKDEVCVACHDVEKAKKVKNGQLDKTAKGFKSVTQAHNKCVSCHKTEVKSNCTFCHSNSEKGPFNHSEVTGWKLNRFHKDLKCQACHGNKKQFTKLNNHCKSCHSGWTQDNFDHKITGLILDENHKDADCEDCHTDRNYSAPPACDNCHDNKSFPKNVPGKLILIKK